MPVALPGYLSHTPEGSASSSDPSEERALGSYIRSYVSFSLLDINGYMVGWALDPKAVTVCVI